MGNEASVEPMRRLGRWRLPLASALAVAARSGRAVSLRRIDANAGQLREDVGRDRLR